MLYVFLLQILSMKALDISFDIPFKSCVVPLVIDNITTVAEMQTMLKQKARLDEDNLIFKVGKELIFAYEVANCK